MQFNVVLNKKLKGKELIDHLIKAAEANGLRPTIHDFYKLEYNIGKGLQKDYDRTHVRIRRKLVPIPSAVVSGIDKNEDKIDRFYILTGLDSFGLTSFPYIGLISKRKINKYLETLSQLLYSHNQKASSSVASQF